MAKGDARATSAVDFPVGVGKGLPAFALGPLLIELQDLLGRKVDLVTPNSLHSAMRDKILSEATEL